MRAGAFCCLLLFSFAAQAEEYADGVFVDKSERRLELLKDGKPIRSYTIALGPEPVGPKTQQGDGKTPEGKYVIDYRNGASGYHKALHISYPDAKDRARARKKGVSAGGDVMIHGLPNNIPDIVPGQFIPDWTNGCIAVRNAEIDEIWKMVKNGTPIQILP